jgi:hypothetical protein
MVTTDSGAASRYLQHVEMLTDIAVSEFHLDPGVADELVEEVLIASLRHTPDNLAEWLTGAMLCAVQSHLRTR